MSAQHTPRPIGRALLDAAMLERIAAAVLTPHDVALCAVARRMRERAELQDELLEALQAFMALDESFTTTCDRHLDEMAKESAMARAVKLARAAIAKATGGAS